MTKLPFSRHFLSNGFGQHGVGLRMSDRRSTTLSKLSKRRLLVERLEHRVLMTATLGNGGTSESHELRCDWTGWSNSSDSTFDFRTRVPSSIAEEASVVQEAVLMEVVWDSVDVRSEAGSSLGAELDLGSGVGGDIDFSGGGDIDAGATLADAPTNWDSLAPSRTVTQWIEGVYHRWDEYDVAGTSQFFIVLTLPEQKPLSAEESAELMVRSASWLHFIPEPIDPALYSTVDPSELSKLLPDQPFYMIDADAGNRTVLGNDDRVRVPLSSVQIAPWYNVGFQSNTYPTNESFRCTAFAVTPNVALTNGHCVFNSGRGGYVTSARFTPGQFQASAGGSVIRPFGGPYNAVAWETNPTYLTDPADAAAHDYAAMFFETGFDTIGINTFVPLVFNAVPDQVEIIGYPGTAQGQPTQTMWTDTGAATIASDNRILTYVADSSGGNSGGPMWHWVNGSPRVVGIHAFGSTNFNGGPRLSSHNLNIINEWLQWTPDGQGSDDIGDSLSTAEATLLGPAAGSYEIVTELGDGDFATLDVDLFQFSAVAGSTVTIQTAAVTGGQSVDTILRLFDSAGNQIAVNDDSTGLYSLISIAIEETGTYFVGVSGFPNFQYTPSFGGSGVAGSVGDYSLSIELFEPAPDAEPLVGVDFGPLGSGSPANWTLYSGGGVQFTMTNLIDETGTATPIDLSVRTLHSTNTFFSDSSTPPGNLIPNHSQSLSAIDGNIFAAADAEFLWSDLTPGETYEIYVFASDTENFSTDVIVYGGGNPYTFNQTVTANSLNINGQAGDSSRTLQSYAIIVEADQMGQIRVETRRLTTFIGFAGLAIRPGEPLPPSGGISGFKWNDLNGDGVWDANEPGLPDWTIYIDENNNGQLDSGELSTTTSGDGSYQFVGLPPGVYTVAEVMQDDWIQTFPGFESIPEQGSSKGGSASDDPNRDDPDFDPAVAEERLRKIADRVKDNPNYQVDTLGNVLGINPFIIDSRNEDSSRSDGGEARFPLSETFLLNSVPGANKTIYLDFDGHTTVNTAWNSNFTNGNPIVTPPYSLDGDASFSNAELTQIQQIWEIVSEDFRPFNVNVTTQDPGVAALVNSGGSDSQWGIRVVFGANNWFSNVGGVAYLTSFNWANDTPTFVFNVGLVGASEAASHEVGHTLGLVHDGRTGEEYYGGHGTGATGWAPIMGVGYSRQLVQWSRGEYLDASNQEDDLRIIVSNNGFGYRIDDHAGTFAAASILNTSPSSAPGFVQVADEGIIERNTDVDFFVFTTGSGIVNLSITPFHRSPNLDILATLYDSDGAVVASSNPVNSLNASFQLDLPAGTYFLAIEGTGRAAVGSDLGYSDYGSLGYYSITGTLIAATLPGTHQVFVGDEVVPNINFGNRFDGPLLGEIRGSKWHDLNEDGVWDANEPALEGWTIYLDENQNGEFDSGETFVVTGPDGSYVFASLPPGTYFVGEVMQSGWAQTFPDFQTSDSASGFSGGVALASGAGSRASGQRSALGSSGADSSVSDQSDIGSRQTKGDVATTLVNVEVVVPADTDQVDPLGPIDANVSLVAMALQRVADLSQYSDQQLADTTQWVVMVGANASPRDVAANVGGRLVSQVPLLDNSFLVEFERGYDFAKAINNLEQIGGVSIFFPLVADQKSRRLVPNDPLFGQQWHLRNTGQFGGTAGLDSRASLVWDSYLGDGVVIAIVDDGLEHTHPDLAERYLAAFSYDLNDDDPDPSPTANFFNHGTAVAGVAAATGNNGIGVTGVAPQASLAGIRLIAGPMTDLMEALAMSLYNQDIDVYNNSWGPPDTGSIDSGSRPGPLALAALESGVTEGRGGLGSIYVWAGGNGRQSGDNVNYDGYANSRFTIAVAAIDNNGVQAPYSEPGAPLIVSGYSSGSAVGITTTDLVANGSYFGGFGGTSSAAPLVAGVVALMLEANPNLGWRDVQNILIDSATHNHASDSDWVVNGAGRLVNHKYGFGAIDAATAVDLAEGWTNLGPQVSASSGVINVGQSIPDNNALGVASSFTFDTAIDVEYVEIVFDATHTYRGDLSIVLTSPDGTQSILAEPRADSGDDYSNWVFTSARHWGESSAGEWTLVVRDLVTRDLGTFNSWRINVHGTSSDSQPSGFHRVDLAGGQVVVDVNFGNRTLDTLPPIVSDMMVGSSAWTSSFVNHVASGSVGISMPADAISPWGGINRLYVQFSEPVEGFTANNVDLRGVRVPDYNPLITEVTYDSANHRGIIELNGPIGRDRLRLSVSSAVTDLAGNPLDGNDDGTGGDLFSRLFGVLPADSTRNGTVDGSDLVAFSASFNRSIGSPDYNALADWNGNGVVDGSDLVFFSANFNRSLPSGQPGGPSFPIPPAASRAFASSDSGANEVITILDDLGWPKRSIGPDVIVPLVASFNSSIGSPKYNPEVDYNNDGRVDRDDVVVAWQNFIRGESAVNYRPSAIVKPTSTDRVAGTSESEIQDAVFGDLDTRWNEPADAIELLLG